jgi:bifunctional DNase/RNase
MSNYVPMELVKIILSDINDHQVIYLQERGGTRSFPIVIGRFEASRINSRVQGEEHTRPLSHDFLKNTIKQLGGVPQKILINRLEEHTYFAILNVEQDGKMHEIDCRPSDAIALAVCYDPFISIFVDEEILDSVA